MQGDQPTAKIAPSPNDASHPPRRLTTASPTRSNRPTLPSGRPLSEIVPVAEATERETPASSGRRYV